MPTRWCSGATSDDAESGSPRSAGARGACVKRHRVGVLTTTRADYGLLRWVMEDVRDDDELDLLVYVTGSHLAPEFGSTVDRIVADGIPIHRRIEILLAADTPTASAKAMGLAMHGFGDALAEDRPDVMVVLGDRFEIVPVALACVLHGVPVAHIHGGETTEGALDEYFRHAVTKLATLHFAATEAYRRRILQMGEAPERVHAFGAPGLDGLHRMRPLSRDALQEVLGMPLDRLTALVTYHPVTTEPGRSGAQVEALLTALLAETNVQAVVTKANADAEGRSINRRLEAFCREHPERFRLVDNLGSEVYLSCLRHFDLLVGNSSSGIIEAPSFALPAVNVGTRQAGRIRGANVIDVGYAVDDIRHGIAVATTSAFRDEIQGSTNPYDPVGDGTISRRMVGAIKQFVQHGPRRGKPFVDLDVGAAHG